MRRRDGLEGRQAGFLKKEKWDGGLAPSHLWLAYGLVRVLVVLLVPASRVVAGLTAAVLLRLRTRFRTCLRTDLRLRSVVLLLRTRVVVGPVERLNPGSIVWPLIAIWAVEVRPIGVRILPLIWPVRVGPLVIFRPVGVG